MWDLYIGHSPPFEEHMQTRAQNTATLTHCHAYTSRPSTQTPLTWTPRFSWSPNNQTCCWRRSSILTPSRYPTCTDNTMYIPISNIAPTRYFVSSWILQWFPSHQLATKCRVDVYKTEIKRQVDTLYRVGIWFLYFRH